MTTQPHSFFRALLASMLFLTPNAPAQTYPSKNITMIVPYSAGGSSDVLTRAVAKQLGDGWPRSNIIVENRAGASGMIGADAVAKAEPDGYTLLGTTSSYPGTVAVRKELPFDPESFVTVAMIAKAPQILAVHPSVPAKTVREFIDYAKKNPGKLTYSSSGTGGNNHFSMALFASQAGINVRHIPYKGIAPAVTAVASGEVDAVIASHPALLPMLRGDRLRPIAVTSKEASALVPGLPAIAQSGLPDYEYELWWGIFAPKGTPTDRLQALNTAINKILASAEMKQFLDQQGAEATPRSLAQLSDLLPREIARYRKAAQDAGIKPQ